MKKRVLLGLFSALFMVLSPCRAVDYFTEDFGSYPRFDLDGRSLIFTPDGSADYYSAKVVAISALPVDVDVQYTYRLIGGVAVRATGNALSRLADLPVVKTIEKVKPVQGC